MPDNRLPKKGIVDSLIDINKKLKEVQRQLCCNAAGGEVTSFNTRTGAVTLLSADVTTALGFTPYNATNPSNYIALSSPITGYVVGANTALAATDTLLAALGKIQGQINARALTSTTVTLTGAQTLTNKSLTSPALTGTPTTPLAATGTNTTQVASTSFVQQELSARIKGGTATFNADGTLDAFDIPHTLTTVTAHVVTRNSDSGGNLFETQVVGSNIHVHFVAGAPVNGLVIIVNWLAFGA